MSNFKLGKYSVYKKRIGKGAFSTVYKGLNTDNNKTVAIKEISLDTLKNEKIKESIKREANFMRKLNHQNIIKLHDIILDKEYNNIYLILDYHKNGDLTAFLKKQPLKEIYAKKYLRQLSNGLKYLLEKNIIHRDLKPQNILMTDNYDIVITDFGFARYVDNDNLIKTVCGTPMYMAPEIIRYKKYNRKSDLWSVGIILYEMLFGCSPFSAKNFIDLIKNIENNEIKLKESIIISFECEDLLFKLLKKNPEERIDWEDFFNHKWFERDEIMENENKLFEIDMHKSLPKLSSFEISKGQFCSFKHKSIIESNSSISIEKTNNSRESLKESLIKQSESKDSTLDQELKTIVKEVLKEELSNSLKDKDIDKDYSNEFNNDDNNEIFDFLDDSLNTDDNYQNKNTNEDNEIETNTDESNLSNNSDLFHSTDTNRDNKVENKIMCTIQRSEPININNPNVDSFSENINNISNSKSHMFLSKNEYIFIKNNDYSSMSDPTSNNNALSNSFKTILNSSLHFIKQTYNYISSNNKSF